MTQGNSIIHELCVYYLLVSGKKNVSVLGKHFSFENWVCRGGLVCYPFLGL